MKFSRGVDAYRDGELVASFPSTREAERWLREHGHPKATRGRVYDASYRHEGAKGVRVCDEWLGYDGFREWAESHGYADGLVIERRDLSGDYCPENCAWVSPLLDRGHAMPHLRKPVIRRDEEGRVTRYGSETEAAIALISEGRGNVRGNIAMTVSNIHCNLSRRTSVAYGSVWWYEGDEGAPEPDGE